MLLKMLWGIFYSFHGNSIHNFSSCSLCEEATKNICAHIAHYGISIHAPRVGSDIKAGYSANYAKAFQSTLLREERRDQSRYITQNFKFQSTLLRKERQRSACFSSEFYSHFNPRSPCEERRRCAKR